MENGKKRFSGEILKFKILNVENMGEQDDNGKVALL